MSNLIKYSLLLISISCQLGAMIYLFIDPAQVALLAGVFIIALLMLIGILIADRKREKREEEEYVNRDY